MALPDAGIPRDAEFSLAQMTQIAQIVEHTIRSMAEKGHRLPDRRPPPPPPALREDSTASAGSTSTRVGRRSPPPSLRAAAAAAVETTEATSSPENLQPSRPPPGPRSPKEASRRLAPLPDPDALGPASARPTGNRTVSSLELTPLDKTWGQLFEDGVATDRLGQFLRGLANHLVRYPSPAESRSVPLMVRTGPVFPARSLHRRDPGQDGGVLRTLPSSGGDVALGPPLQGECCVGAFTSLQRAGVSAPPRAEATRGRAVRSGPHPTWLRALDDALDPRVSGRRG